MGENAGDLQGGMKRYFRVSPEGRRIPCEPPFDPTPGSDYALWAEDRILEGVSTPSILRYQTYKQEIRKR